MENPTQSKAAYWVFSGEHQLKYEKFVKNLDSREINFHTWKSDDSSRKKN